MRGALLLLAQQWERLDAAERALEGKIKKAALADQAARRLIEVPTVGPITASATVAKVTDVRVFRTARDFSAWVGLTGRDRGTGGKHRVGPISKQGDRMLRTLLINGASSYLRHQKAHGMKIRGSAPCSRAGPTRSSWWRSPRAPRASYGPCSPRENAIARPCRPPLRNGRPGRAHLSERAIMA